MELLNATNPDDDNIFKILIALLVGILTLISGVIINYISKKRDDRTRKLQIKLDYLRSQIQDFYGPIYSLIQQINLVWNVREAILKPDVNQQNDNRLKIYFRENLFQPLHAEIRNLIKSKFHLIEGVELPDSFILYLEHSTQETVQINIWNDLHVDTSYSKGTPWPTVFEEDVKKTLDELMKRYDETLKELG